MPNREISQQREVVMKKLFFCFISLAFISCIVTQSYAFRCGNLGKNLVRKGMHKQQIINDCGQPNSKEIVGINETGNSTRIVEEWTYIIHENAYDQMYLIRFDENGLAAEIKWLGEYKGNVTKEK